MKSFSIFILIIACLLTVGCASYTPRTTPVQVAFWYPIQAVPEECNVKGLRLDLPMGYNYNVTGLDFGIINGALRFYGVQVGWINWAEVHGVQGAVGVLVALNVSPGLKGAQLCAGIPIGCNFAGEREGSDDADGVQICAGLPFGINAARNVDGVQVTTAVNFVQKVRGLQFALLNLSKQAVGVQLGLVNVTKDLSGVQFGLVNASKNGFLPVFPIINVGFGGDDDAK